MANHGGDPLEKSVNSTNIPSTSESLNLWETEQIDHSVLSHYYEKKSPISPLTNNPQSKIFTINLEPSKHFTSCRGSFISFDVRLIKLPNHDKLPPIHPTSSDSTQTVVKSSNDNPTSSGIDQSEGRLHSPLTQHECVGNRFVLDQASEQDPDELQRKRQYEEKKERYEMEKKKKEERMQRWLKEQEEYRRRWQKEYGHGYGHGHGNSERKKCNQRRRDLTTEGQTDAKRRKISPQREFHDRKRKMQTDCLTDKDIDFEMRKKRKKKEEEKKEEEEEEEEEDKDKYKDKDDPPTPAPTPFKGANFDNCLGK